MLRLIEELGHRLTEAQVPHCLWKGAGKAERWGTGLGDVDLLIAEDAAAAAYRLFREVGFREARPALSQTELIRHFFAADPGTGTIVHFHTFERLILGRPWQPRFRLPVEAALIESARPGEVFDVPDPALGEFARLCDKIAKMGFHDLLKGIGSFSNEAVLEPGELNKAAAHLGIHMDERVGNRLLKAVRSDATLKDRWTARQQLRRTLGPPALRPGPVGRVWYLASRLRLPTIRGNRVVGGGTVVALVGGDGAGKSTAAAELHRWLEPHLAVLHLHLGRPPRSGLATLTGAFLKVARVFTMPGKHSEPSLGEAWLTALRTLVTARDRLKLALKAQEWASRGYVVITERYPIDGNQLLVGPSIPSLLPSQAVNNGIGQWLVRKEMAAYRRIPPPNAAFVLLVDPDIAVKRKTTEPADYVAARNRSIASVDWTAKGVEIIDANQPPEAVHRDLKLAVWGAL